MFLQRNLGQPEIQDLRLPAVADEDVGRLDVAVHDAAAVRRIQRIGDLDAQLHNPLRRQRLVFDAVLQRGPFQQLHGDEVLVALAANVVDGANVRVVEGGRGPRFALETLQRLRVPGDLRRQELEGDKAAQARVLRLVDDAHAAAAQLFQYLIMRNRSSDHPSPKKVLPYFIPSTRYKSDSVRW